MKYEDIDSDKVYKMDGINVTIISKHDYNNTVDVLSCHGITYYSIEPSELKTIPSNINYFSGIKSYGVSG